MNRYFFLVIAVIGVLTGCGPATLTIVEPERYVDLNDADDDGVIAEDDCNDANSAIHPGHAEVCDDGFDNDCNPATPDESVQYYADEDNDGFGDSEVGYSTCGDATGFVTNSDDCDDTERTVNPDATDTPNNGVDEDCDGEDIIIDPIDNDGDGFTAGDDCDDENEDVNPDADEYCDGIDNDCSGLPDDNAVDAITWYEDSDGDGFGNELVTVAACEVPTDYVALSGDCDDVDSLTYPSAPEDCLTGVDNNCDGYVGSDDNDGDGVPACDDCDDGDFTIAPGADEYCDGIDNDCDALVDEEALDLQAFYVDDDGDGYGTNEFVLACSLPFGHAINPDDCDDADEDVNPIADDICDGLDNDCDGTADNDSTYFSAFFRDADGDAYGNAAIMSLQCFEGDGYVADATDCADDRPQSYPGATEICNGVDDDCNGVIDDGAVILADWYLDDDGDGYGAGSATNSCASPGPDYVDVSGDCDDGNIDVNPGAYELCNGFDDDCDGDVDDDDSHVEDGYTTFYVDSDGDTFGNPSVSVLRCEAPVGYVTNDEDCNDALASVKPTASEIVADGLDNNCNGTELCYRDTDGDTFGSSLTVASADLDCTDAGEANDALDCNDANSTIKPGATEVCDGIDQDCDSTADEGLPTSSYYLDGDSDTYGAGTATVACASPGADYVTNDDDCDDESDLAFPGGVEACDGLDNDCDGTIDDGAAGLLEYFADADGDTYGDALDSVMACAQPPDYTDNADDCDDTDAAINPDATETDSAVDEDCDGNPFVLTTIVLDGGGTSATIDDPFNLINDESSTFKDSLGANSIGDWLITEDRSTTAVIGDLGPYTVPFLSASGLTAGSYAAMSMLPGNLAWVNSDMCVGIEVDVIATDYVLSFAVRNTAGNDNDICAYLDGVAQDCVTIPMNTHTHIDIGVASSAASVQTLELCTGRVQGGVDITSVGLFEATITP
ncbi:putative metal-binding motif-containing protein [Patescibacteria group bacterium]|nr:putative metal-binding motif-containing protein [Patescibacteria group bacterium]